MMAWEVLRPAAGAVRLFIQAFEGQNGKVVQTWLASQSFIVGDTAGTGSRLMEDRYLNFGQPVDHLEPLPVPEHSCAVGETLAARWQPLANRSTACLLCRQTEDCLRELRTMYRLLTEEPGRIMNELGCFGEWPGSEGTKPTCFVEDHLSARSVIANVYDTVPDIYRTCNEFAYPYCPETHPVHSFDFNRLMKGGSTRFRALGPDDIPDSVRNPRNGEQQYRMYYQPMDAPRGRLPSAMHSVIALAVLLDVFFDEASGPNARVLAYRNGCAALACEDQPRDDVANAYKGRIFSEVWGHLKDGIPLDDAGGGVYPLWKYMPTVRDRPYLHWWPYACDIDLMDMYASQESWRSKKQRRDGAVPGTDFHAVSNQNVFWSMPDPTSCNYIPNPMADSHELHSPVDTHFWYITSGDAKVKCSCTNYHMREVKQRCSTSSSNYPHGPFLDADEQNRCKECKWKPCRGSRGVSWGGPPPVRNNGDVRWIRGQFVSAWGLLHDWAIDNWHEKWTGPFVHEYNERARGLMHQFRLGVSGKRTGERAENLADLYRWGMWASHPQDRERKTLFHMQPYLTRVGAEPTVIESDAKVSVLEVPLPRPGALSCKEMLRTEDYDVIDKQPRVGEKRKRVFFF